MSDNLKSDILKLEDYCGVWENRDTVSIFYINENNEIRLETEEIFGYDDASKTLRVVGSGSFSGNIAATSGDIGGFIITQDALYDKRTYKEYVQTTDTVINSNKTYYILDEKVENNLLLSLPFVALGLLICIYFVKRWNSYKKTLKNLNNLRYEYDRELCILYEEREPKKPSDRSKKIVNFSDIYGFMILPCLVIGCVFYFFDYILTFFVSLVNNKINQ